MSITRDTRLYIDPSNQQRDLGDEIVIVTEGEKLIHTMKDSALELWRLIGDGTAAGKLADHLTESYGIDETTAMRDLDAFIADCVEKGLLRAGA